MTYNNLYTDGPAGSTKYLTGDVVILGDVDLESSGGTAAFFDVRNDGTTDDYNIEIEGNWISEITFLARTGTVTFDGTSAQTVNTLGGETFNDLTINKVGTTTKADSTLTMGSNVSTNGTLTMTSGFVDLTNFDLNVNSGSSIAGGDERAYFIVDEVGVLRHAVTSTGTLNFPIGDEDDYAPFTFTLNSGTLSSSNVTINMRDAIHTNIAESDYISRYWSFENEGIVDPNYTVSYTYTDDDVVGTESDLLARKFSTSDDVRGGSVNTATNVITSGTLAHFCDHTAESGPETLPVTLVSFTGQLTEKGVVLEWKTASELDNDYFEVQHSLDGVEFEVIGEVDGNGTTNEELEYTFTHKTPRPGVNYYRLRQVDFDGASENHMIIRIVNNSFKVGMQATVYPNPATNDDLNVKILSGDDHTPIIMKVVDILGKEYYLNEIEGSLSVDQKIESKEKMLPGMYFIIIKQGDNIINEKILIRD